MLRYIQTTPTASDCTACYAVELDKGYTVEGFIEAVLKRDLREWGKFAIFNEDHPFGYPWIRYTCGSLKESFPTDILKRKVVKVTSNGGWSLMNYIIWTE